MNLSNNIKRPFLTTAIAVLSAFVVISSTFSIKSAYAEGSDGYKPDYTWAEELGRDIVRVSEIRERMGGDYARILNQMPEHPKAITKDIIGSIPGFGPLHNALVFDVREIVQTQNDDLRYLKGIKALSGPLIPFPTNTLEQAIQRDWDIIPPEPYIPTQQDIEEFQNFRSGIMENVTVQELRNNELISTQHYETLDFDSWREQLRLQEQDLKNSLDDAFYQEQYQSEQFKMPHSSTLRNFRQPSIDLQSYKSLELSQSYIDNLRSLETNMRSLESFKMPDFSKYQDTMNSMHRQHMYRIESQHRRSLSNLSNIPPSVSYQLQNPGGYQIPDFSKYQNAINKMAFQQSKYLSSLDSPRTTMDYIHSIQHGAESIQPPSFSDYQNVINRIESRHLNSLDNWSNINPTVRRILQNPEPPQMPDFSKYQNMANQMNTQFNNLPSPSTVYQDHFFHNDIGRSFRQQPIYQLPSVDLGTIRITPPTIQRDYGFYNQMPRYDPIQMPRYEPIQMPKFDPIRIEPIRMPPMHFGGGFTGGGGAGGGW